MQSCWFAVDLGAGRSLSPMAYTLRHGREDGTDALRNWEFQGSNDGKVHLSSGRAALNLTQGCTPAPVLPAVARITIPME